MAVSVLSNLKLDSPPIGVSRQTQPVHISKSAAIRAITAAVATDPPFLRLSDLRSVLQPMSQSGAKCPGLMHTYDQT